KVKNSLAKRRPKVLYQRHWRFNLSGAFLSWRLGVPLVLECQASEVWRSKNWDPAHFVGLIESCESLQFQSAASFVGLSNVLKNDFVSRGVEVERIVVNPAGVDPARFSPGQQRAFARERLRVGPQEVLATFVGSFSYWHGVFVLRDAILRVFESDSTD